MRQLLILSTLIILCFSFSAHAQDNFSSPEAFVKSISTGGAQLSLKARGDLNGDGLADWAGVIRRQRPDESPTYQLYVLLRQRQGGYSLAEKSIEEEIPGMGCCWAEDLRITRSSIYIQNNAKDASTMEAATHQFKLYNGVWRLIGLRIYLVDHSSDVSTETDMNLLTGAVIEKKQKGENRPTTKRRNKKFATYLLKDFDFSNGFGAEVE